MKHIDVLLPTNSGVVLSWVKQTATPNCVIAKRSVNPPMINFSASILKRWDSCQRAAHCQYTLLSLNRNQSRLFKSTYPEHHVDLMTGKKKNPNHRLGSWGSWSFFFPYQCGVQRANDPSRKERHPNTESSSWNKKKHRCCYSVDMLIWNMPLI